MMPLREICPEMLRQYTLPYQIAALLGQYAPFVVPIVSFHIILSISTTIFSSKLFMNNNKTGD